ncbi:MAG: hypothetical protein ACREUF_06130 [Solimonas sp.]
MSIDVRLRKVEPNDLPIFYEQQLDADATRMAAFPARDRAAFDAHWATNILGNPAAVKQTILVDGQVAGNIGIFAGLERADYPRIQARALGIFNSISPQFRMPYYWSLDPATQEEFNRLDATLDRNASNRVVLRVIQVAIRTGGQAVQPLQH